ncbi:MAG: carbohydrate ABC transporter permease [Candidatus Sumerlaeota bacterium]
MTTDDLKGSSGFQRRYRYAPYFFLLPFFLITAVFFIYPLIQAVPLAFYQTNGPLSRAWVGLDNFIFILTDEVFHKAVFNTCFYAFFSVFLQLPLALCLALLLNSRKDKLKGFFRLLLFSPNLVGQVFVGVIFSVIFIPRFGLFNRFLHALIGWGLEEHWLDQPELVMPAIVLTALWLYTGFNMIYFLAGLQSVDQDLIDAARIDGANAWQVFWNVTFPAIKPVATFVVVISTIGSFQSFELPYSLLRNYGEGFGPQNSGMTIVGYLYDTAFNSGDLGTGAAVGWILALIIFSISVVQIRLSGTLRREA